MILTLFNRCVEDVVRSVALVGDNRVVPGSRWVGDDGAHVSLAMGRYGLGVHCELVRGVHKYTYNYIAYNYNTCSQLGNVCEAHLICKYRICAKPYLMNFLSFTNLLFLHFLLFGKLNMFFFSLEKTLNKVSAQVLDLQSIKNNYIIQKKRGIHYAMCI